MDRRANKMTQAKLVDWFVGVDKKAKLIKPGGHQKGYCLFYRIKSGKRELEEHL
jgi:hypothetical protein